MPETPATKQKRILVIRRDNIGDLVCTTPLLTALRRRFPDAWIGVWVNSYNAPVLDGNPDISIRYVYTKAKHREAGQSYIGIFTARLGMLARLRAMGLTDVIVATTTAQPRLVRMARWLKPGRVVAYGDSGADLNIPIDVAGRHEVEDVLRSAAAFDIKPGTGPGVEPPCTVVAPPGSQRDPARVAIHISARKPSQRWSAENFAALIRILHAQHPGLHFRLLWAPGAGDDPRHPGDDAKAAQIMQLLDGRIPVEGVATQTLPQLIAAIADCGRMVCADGGAMHLAAGLGLGIVCMFGNSGAARWRPWGVPYVLLQKPSLSVADIAVEEVAAAFSSLPDDTPAAAAAVQP